MFTKKVKMKFDFSELEKNQDSYETNDLMKFVGKMKIETSPVIILDSFTALRSKSHCFSYANIEKGRQKGIQKTPEKWRLFKIHYFYQKQQMQQIIL